MVLDRVAVEAFLKLVVGSYWVLVLLNRFLHNVGR